MRFLLVSVICFVLLLFGEEMCVINLVIFILWIRVLIEVFFMLSICLSLICESVCLWFFVRLVKIYYCDFVML